MREIKYRQQRVTETYCSVKPIDVEALQNQELLSQPAAGNFPIIENQVKAKGLQFPASWTVENVLAAVALGVCAQIEAIPTAAQMVGQAEEVALVEKIFPNPEIGDEIISFAVTTATKEHTGSLFLPYHYHRTSARFEQSGLPFFIPVLETTDPENQFFWITHCDQTTSLTPRGQSLMNFMADLIKLEQQHKP